MDKNTITGFILIAAIMVGFVYLNKPSEEQIAQQRKYNDSIALVKQAEVEALQKMEKEALESANVVKTDTVDSRETEAKVLTDAFGEFRTSATGEDKTITLENDVLKLQFSTLGGGLSKANLKSYTTYDSLPLILMDKEHSKINFAIPTASNRIINTSQLYFSQEGDVVVDTEGNKKLILRAKTAVADSYLDFIYTIPAKGYMIVFEILPVGLDSIISPTVNTLEMDLSTQIRQNEQGYKFEERYSSIFYKYLTDDVESLNADKNETKTISNKLKWIAFKDQFFSAIFIAKDAFASTELRSEKLTEGTGYIKGYQANTLVAFDPAKGESTSFNLYLGPNKYSTLSAYDKEKSDDEKLYIRDLVPLGWGIFGWINRLAIIPMFNLFSRFLSNYGIIILLMTLVIKTVIFPLTYKSYLSSAKMRVLKPEIDEINAKIPPEKSMERQQATMKLYNKVGVNPMSGCLPMLLQMPILIAMFNFFPASIELRQESFLWATDLSTYDSIFSWHTYIPIISQYFGNHISLFCLLMTITSIISTKLNTANTQMSSDQPGAGMMKWMMYLMPLMFMFIFNNYASGLSYYYFLSTLISIIQTYAIRATIDEKRLYAKLQANAKKNSSGKTKKKGGWMERLERMQREQQKAIRNQNQKKR